MFYYIHNWQLVGFFKKMLLFNSGKPGHFFVINVPHLKLSFSQMYVCITQDKKKLLHPIQFQLCTNQTVAHLITCNIYFIFPANERLENVFIYCFQVRNQTEKLANGIQIGSNYRLYAVERVRNNSILFHLSFKILCSV